MPRGVPKAGFRKTKNWKKQNKMAKVMQTEPLDVETDETDEEIAQKLTDRFEILEMLTEASLNGICRSLIVSGPAGLGKSYTVETALRAWDPEEVRHTIIRGTVTKTGLFRTLYEYRFEGNVIVFDDSDRIFFDDDSLNMMKAVCDTTDRRRVSYMGDYKVYSDKEATVVPATFDFEGTIIFISNLDFDGMSGSDNKIAPHLQAMVSRSQYIDLAMKTRRDYLIRIRQVVEQGLLEKHGLSKKEADDTMRFVEDNFDKLREMSLRIALKIGDLRRMSEEKWEKMARVTCLKAG